MYRTKINCIAAQELILLDSCSPELQSHVRECAACRELQQAIGRSFAMLDEPVQVPEGLYDKLVALGTTVKPVQVKKRDISLVFQFSTVIAAAIILGITLGIHANTKILSRDYKKTEALIELKEIHHLNVDRQNIF